jgi:hypothetical protein
MNLDETGVPLFMGDLRGSIMWEPRAGRGKVLPTQNVPRSFTRAAVTHVAIICNGPETQLYLPQLFLGDSSTLTVQAQRDVQAAAPPNVTVWRLQSRWLDVAVVKTLLRTISLNLRANSPGLRPVLIWDCCPAHVKDEVLRAARSCGIYIVLVPAKLTWLVQPLDACVFQRYKAVLRESYARVRQAAAHGVVTPAVWWRCLVEHAHVFMHSHGLVQLKALDGSDMASMQPHSSTNNSGTSCQRRRTNYQSYIGVLQDLLPPGRGSTASALRRASATARPRVALAPAPAGDSAAQAAEGPTRGPPKNGRYLGRGGC